MKLTLSKKDYKSEVKSVAEEIIEDTDESYEGSISKLVHKATKEHIFINNPVFFDYVIGNAKYPDEINMHFDEGDKYAVYMEFGADGVTEVLLELATMYAFNKDVSIAIKKLLGEWDGNDVRFCW